MYDYYEAVKEDILQYIKENIDAEENDIDEIERHLDSDNLFNEDSITGNGSGPYTFSRAQAQEYVEENKDLVREMCSEFGFEEQVKDWWFSDDYESIDVSIRCYVLGNAISSALEELREAAE